LLGAGSRCRKTQPRVSFKGEEYASTLPDLETLIQRSEWITRAWCFQEALLSKRWLIFTDYQVFFDCYTMHASESTSVPLESLHTRCQTSLSSWVKPSNVLPRNGVGNRAEEVWARITEYSSKSLTYDSDILNGIMGILENFERRQDPTFHHFGVPTCPSERPKQALEGCPEDQFSSGFL
jgi:hypothetical protein